MHLKKNIQLQYKRVKFWEIVRGIKANNLVFIDESGVKNWEYFDYILEP